MIIKTGHPKGYESILIDFVRKNYSNELLIKYPQLKVNPQATGVDRKKFYQIFKKRFTEKYLVEIIQESLKYDPERKQEKFPFELKLKPFFERINNFINRNINIQFNLP